MGEGAGQAWIAGAAKSGRTCSALAALKKLSTVVTTPTGLFMSVFLLNISDKWLYSVIKSSILTLITFKSKHFEVAYRSHLTLQYSITLFGKTHLTRNAFVWSKVW